MWYRATILSRRQLSPTITGLTLKVDPPPDGGLDFVFLPGQWVDFRPCPSSTWNPPDGGKTVGGYSLTSTPRSLPLIDLAIQRSRHPVAAWATDRARPDDVVDVRVGGSFTYRSRSDDEAKEVRPTNRRLLFVAGGVGINPLYSMIRQWHADRADDDDDANARAVLLYSGRAGRDLLFVDQLGKLMKENSRQFRVIFTATQRQTELNEVGIGNEQSGRGDVEIRTGRIDSEMIRGAVNWLNRSDGADEGRVSGQERNVIADAVFVCGPPGMPESMTKILSEEKLVRSASNVYFEKWW